jgi:hypothetical protein
MEAERLVPSRARDDHLGMANGRVGVGARAATSSVGPMMTYRARVRSEHRRVKRHDDDPTLEIPGLSDRVV